MPPIRFVPPAREHLDALVALLAAEGWSHAEDPQRTWRALTARRDERLREEFALRVGAVRATVARLIEREAALRGRELPLGADGLAAVVRALGIGLAAGRLVDPEAIPPELFGDFVELLFALLFEERQPGRSRRRDCRSPVARKVRPSCCIPWCAPTWRCPRRGSTARAACGGACAPWASASRPASASALRSWPSSWSIRPPARCSSTPVFTPT